MGGAVTIGLLMMASGAMMASRAMPEGCWESPTPWESGCTCLDVSLGPEVLALFGEIRCTDGSEGGEVGGLCVEYRRWGGLEGTPPSEDGTVGAWEAWDESWGAEALGRASRNADGFVWPPLMRAMAEIGKRQRCLLLLGGHGAWNGEEIASQGGGKLLTTEDGSCEINRSFGGL